MKIRKNNTPAGRKVFKKMRFFAVQYLFPFFEKGKTREEFYANERNPLYCVGNLPPQDWVIQAHDTPDAFSKEINKHVTRSQYLKGAWFSIERIESKEKGIGVRVVVQYKKDIPKSGIGKTTHM